MALIKTTTNEQGFEADFWVITNFNYIRKGLGFDLKIIVECFIGRDLFNLGKQPLARIARHFDVASESLTLADMYALLKAPVMVADAMERVHEEDINQEPKEQTYHNENYFSDATDQIN